MNAQTKDFAMPHLISTGASGRIANMNFVSALLVVLIHCYTDSERGSMCWWFTEIFGGGKWLTGGFVRCAMPWFFLVSGYLLYGKVTGRDWWRKEILKRIHTLVIPYFICSFAVTILFIVYWIITKHELPGGILLLKLSGLQWHGLPFLKQLWFLRCLFVLVVCSAIIWKFLSPLSLAVLFLLHGAYDMHFLPFSSTGYSFFGTTLSLAGLFYFALGAYLRKMRFNFALSRRYLPGAACLTFVLLGAYASFDFMGMHIAMLFKWLAIPFSLVTLLMIIPETRFAAILTRNAFPMFLLHFPTLSRSLS